ncbi:MAG: nucleotidyltransferase domain-containing protein [Bacteroidales bacterium]|jgi:predicted nucleotidyltransferase|nr:nucleotidyltransferase domain-containing protein [Bacteroidales bacterium]
MITQQQALNLLRDYKATRASKYGIEKIGLFGSLARETQTEESDIDIYIVGSLNGFCALAMIKTELEELLQNRVDVVRLRERMNPVLKKIIEKEGIYV